MTANQSAAAEQLMECPHQLAPESIRLADDKSGWIGFVPEPLLLTAAGFMQGQPSTRADLKPFSTARSGSGSVVKWKFEGPYPEGKWLSCEYAQGAVSLARRIDDSFTECSVTYRKTKHGTQSVQSIACR
jgi:hypothetical protein